MKLHSLGMDYHHDSDFLIERPNGSGDDLVLVFKTPAVIRLNNNIEHIPSGSAVVYSSDFHQYYGADNGEYINHWVHFDRQENSFIQRIGLPLNTVFSVKDMVAVERYMELLSLESLSDGTNSGESVDLLLRLLLTKLAEGADRNISSSSPHCTALRELRAAVRRNPADKRSIEELAQAVSLSPSHFQYLYKQEFGVSCYEDILTARLDMAKYYLRSTSLPVKRIAELCGYDNDVHFIRQFKKRTGMTAGEYRKQN